jgi:hypothetical protein
MTSAQNHGPKVDIIITDDPGTWLRGKNRAAAHKGQLAKQVARNRKRDAMAKESRRRNRPR